MSQKTIVLTVILFALIVLGMFMFARLRTVELQNTTGSIPKLPPQNVLV